MTGHRNPTRISFSESDRAGRGFGSGTLLRAASRVRLPKPHLLRVPRWITWFALCVAIGFLGWIIYLSTGITSIVTTHHYDIAWLGFDALELSLVAGVALAAWKHHPSTTILTGICAVMFAVDAWFDVWTSPRGGVLSAAILAFGLEVPLVAVFTLATIHGERARTRQGLSRGPGAAGLATRGRTGTLPARFGVARRCSGRDEAGPSSRAAREPRGVRGLHHRQGQAERARERAHQSRMRPAKRA